MDDSPVLLLDELTRQRQIMAQDISVIERKIDDLKSRHEALVKDRSLIDELLSNLPLLEAGGPANFKPTRKNLQVLKIWLAIKKLIGSADAAGGISQRDLFNETRREFPDLKNTTFRAYLFRFREGGLIRKVSSTGKWRLSETGG